MQPTSTAPHQARKRFGQNFLIDQGVIRRICRSIGATAKDKLVEIGPGQGAITRGLLQACPSLDVIELDRDLIPVLMHDFSSYPECRIHEADALKFDFRALRDDERRLRIVGNLPYNISTPLIFHLLAQRDAIRDMHFMLQKEVVERMAAPKGSKSYGRLSVMTQYFCEVENLFDVAPECFRPIPKVVSSIVRLTPKPAPDARATNEEFFADLVKLAFQQRRKTLRNAIRSTTEQLDANLLEALELGRRAEQLSVSDFVALSNTLCDAQQRH